jgi:hypothetical protein
MNDEVTPQPEVPATPEVVEQPSGPSKSKLDLLPDKVKQDLHSLIAQGNKGKRVKQALEDRWLGKTDILPANSATYDSYIATHYEAIMAEVKIGQELIETSKQGLNDMKELSEATTNVSLENRKQAMESIFNRVQSRLNWLEKSQTSYPNPHYEQLIGAYLKEMRTIVEKIIANKEALEKDNTDMIYHQLENALYLVLNGTLTVYRKLHPGDESKYEEFKDLLKQEIPSILRTFKSETNND